MKINNFDYEVKFVEPNDQNLLMDDERYHHGVTDFDTKTIYIRNNLDKEVTKYTLLHELTHAFIDAYGLLQIDWNDEVVADFIAAHYENIIWCYKEAKLGCRNIDGLQKNME